MWLGIQTIECLQAEDIATVVKGLNTTRVWTAWSQRFLPYIPPGSEVDTDRLFSFVMIKTLQQALCRIQQVKGGVGSPAFS